MAYVNSFFILFFAYVMYIFLQLMIYNFTFTVIVVLRYLRYMVWGKRLLILHSLVVCLKSVVSPLMR